MMSQVQKRQEESWEEDTKDIKHCTKHWQLLTFILFLKSQKMIENRDNVLDANNQP